MIDPWVRLRIRNGWKPRAIAVACGVSLRTAYRWRRRVLDGTFADVEIGDWIVTLWAPRNGTREKPRIVERRRRP